MDKDKQKKKTTDWRIIGVSGNTADGRTISADELRQMAESYDPEVYGARINLEHLRFLFPDWEGGYGDVLALKAEPWAKDPEKTALLAKLSVLPALQNVWDGGQKIYTSMEIMSDFAETGGAYLVGLAVTDTPASLGTTANFSLAAKTAETKTTIFSGYCLSEQQHTAEPPLTQSGAENLFSRMFKQFFGNKQTESEASTQGDSLPAAEIAALTQAQNDAAALLSALLEERKTEKDEFAKLKQEFHDLKHRLENETASGERTPHGGGEPTSSDVGW